MIVDWYHFVTHVFTDRGLQSGHLHVLCLVLSIGLVTQSKVPLARYVSSDRVDKMGQNTGENSRSDLDEPISKSNITLKCWYYFSVCWRVFFLFWVTWYMYDLVLPAGQYTGLFLLKGLVSWWMVSLIDPLLQIEVLEVEH